MSDVAICAQLGGEHGTAISASLPRCPRLTSLDLGGRGNQLWDEGVTALAGALRDNTALTRLGLAANFVREEGAGALGAMLAGNSALRELHLGHNSVGGGGATAIAAALSGNPRCGLRVLTLDNNDIGHVGASAIAAALAAPDCPLEELSLDGNSIRTEGAVALGEALQRPNRTLTSLSVYNNDIGGAGLRALLAAVTENYCIRRLAASGNHAGGADARRGITAALGSRYRQAHVWLIVRTRAICIAGRAEPAPARGVVIAWLCASAPIWVVVRVCALLRESARECAR